MSDYDTSPLWEWTYVFICTRRRRIQHYMHLTMYCSQNDSYVQRRCRSQKLSHLLCLCLDQVRSISVKRFILVRHTILSTVCLCYALARLRLKYCSRFNVGICLQNICRTRTLRIPLLIDRL